MALKKVNGNSTEYSLITDPAEMRQYVIDRGNAASSSTLYGTPAIAASVYTAGTSAATAIQTAITAHTAAPTLANKDIVKAKMALGVLWLDSLLALVVPIANSPTNCTTREEAAVNIEIAGFTAEKLNKNSKGKPDMALFTATYVGNGVIDIDITNGDEFNPANVIIIAVAVPPVTVPPTPPPIVSLKDGQVAVTSKVYVPVVTKTMSGKGTSAKLVDMAGSPSWMIYIYSMNGNKLISMLSSAGPVNLVTPT